MYNWFQPGALPSLGSLHRLGLGSSIASKDGQPSRDGILAPFVRLAQRPVSALGHLVDEFRSHPSDEDLLQKEVEERKCLLMLSLRSALTLAEWKAAAIELDNLEGNNLWKNEDASTEYNYELVKTRLDLLEDARISCDAPRMLFLIRTSLSRHLGGMGNLQLYKHSHIGTKRLIERYNHSTLETLSSLLEITRQPNPGIDSRVVLEQIVAARQSFGRSALLLSGGGTFGMNHIGVVKCLWEARLLPRIISGASAGSIVCAVLCTRTEDEIPMILEEFCYGDLEVFSKSGGGENAITQITRFLKTGALFDIANLIGVMKNLVGDMTFQEAYNRTRRILNICVSSAGVFELPRLLNFVTAPNVIIWSAVAASCSVPIIFSPADILAKDPKTGAAVHWNPSPQRWIDGSVDNDLPMTRLSELFNVNHFIVSQVNPHVTPFLGKQESHGPFDNTQSQVSLDNSSGIFPKLANLAKDEAMHRMSVLSELGILPNLLTKTRSILSQRYSGDITILPEVSLAQLPMVLQNPNTEFMLQAAAHGERATWPKLSRIQNHCAIELALDDTVQALRARIAFSPSQVDLRLNVINRPISRAGSDGGRAKYAARKSLRFSDKYASTPFPSRPTSRSAEQSLELSKTTTEPIKTLTRERKLRSSPHLMLKAPESPMFSTASDGDDDTDNDTDSTTSPDNPQYDSSSQDDDDYSTRYPEDKKNHRLFPYSTQPSSPVQGSRRSYLGSSSPILSSSITPLPSLIMTPTSQPNLNTTGDTNNALSRSSHNSSISIAADGQVPKPGRRSSNGDILAKDIDAIARYHEALERKFKSSTTLRSWHGP